MHCQPTQFNDEPVGVAAAPPAPPAEHHASQTKEYNPRDYIGTQQWRGRWDRAEDGMRGIQEYCANGIIRKLHQETNLNSLGRKIFSSEAKGIGRAPRQQ